MKDIQKTIHMIITYTLYNMCCTIFFDYVHYNVIIYPFSMAMGSASRLVSVAVDRK